jgi:hypothetical protein
MRNIVREQCQYITGKWRFTVSFRAEKLEKSFLKPIVTAFHFIFLRYLHERSVDVDFSGCRAGIT